MGRSSWMFVLLSGCTYAPPSNASSDASLDPDAMMPDTQPPDSLPPDSATLVSSDHNATQDTWLELVQPTINHGTEVSLISNGSAATALLRFDLAGVTPTTVVEKVELHLVADVGTSEQVGVHRVREAWNETKATWNLRNATTGWTTAGAKAPSSDATTIGTFTPSQPGTEIVVELDVATVQLWVSDPGTNRGLALLPSGMSSPQFRSREAVTGKPFLRVFRNP